MRKTCIRLDFFLLKRINWCQARKLSNLSIRNDGETDERTDTGQHITRKINFNLNETYNVNPHPVVV